MAVVLSGFLLSGIGYKAGVTPDDTVKFRIALLFGPLVGSPLDPVPTTEAVMETAATATVPSEMFSLWNR